MNVYQIIETLYNNWKAISPSQREVLVSIAHQCLALRRKPTEKQEAFILSVKDQGKGRRVRAKRRLKENVVEESGPVKTVVPPWDSP